MLIRLWWWGGGGSLTPLPHTPHEDSVKKKRRKCKEQVKMLELITRECIGLELLNFFEEKIIFCDLRLAAVRSLYSEACQDVYIWNFLILEKFKVTECPAYHQT